MKKESILIHIPHSSTFIPEKSGFIEELVESEIGLMTDWATDKIYDVPGVSVLKVAFSRIFCDVERFPDDKEPMFKKGFGMAYTHTDDGRLLRTVSPELKKRIEHDYHGAHQQKLEDIINEKLEKHHEALIIDGHSFSSMPLRREFNQNPDRPDICLGVDEFHTPAALVERFRTFFEAKGFSVDLNMPYVGTIVPLSRYQKDLRVSSIMIETNKRLYMNEDTLEVDDAKVAKLNRYVRELVQACYMD